MKRKIHLTKYTNNISLKNQNPVFSGIWCLTEDELLKINEHNILQHHWSNKLKFNNDFNYINKIFPKILDDVATCLVNNIQTNYKSNQLKILLSHWLTIYLSVVYDRWLLMENIIKSNYSIYKLSKNIKHHRPFAYIECVNLYQDDQWNELILREIFTFLFNKDSLQENNEKFEEKILHLKPQKKNILNPYNIFKLLNLFKKQYHQFDCFYIDQNVINFSNLLTFYFKNNIKLKEIDELKLSLEIDKNKINNFYKNIDVLKKNNIFEEFFFYRIKKDIPLNYLATPINIKNNNLKKIFLSGSKHQSCDVSKWNIIIGKNLNNNSELLTSRHGGGLPASKPERFNQDELIADRCLTFFKSYEPQRTQVRNLKIKKINKYDKLLSNIFKKKDILVLGFENLKLCHKMSFSYISSNYIEYIKLIDRLFNYILYETDKKITYRPYPKRNAWNSITRIKLQYQNKIMIDNKQKLLKSIKNYNLIICTYPQTTFSECLYNNIPVILLFDPTVWKIDENFRELLDEMIKLRIVHVNIESFKLFYSQYSDNILSYWMKKDVQNLIKKYNDLCLGINFNAYKVWEQIFKI